MDSSTSSSSSDDNEVLDDINKLQNYASMIDEAFTVFESSSTRISIQRDRENANQRLFEDYFSENPVYGDALFRRRFRMLKELFLRIVTDMEQKFQWFTLRWDARGKRGFTPLQKCVSAIRQLAYGVIPDATDKYLKMSERVSRECLENFCFGVIRLYAPEYLRKPMSSDIQLLYEAHEARHRFPGMLGSINCTHWEWRNFPTVWRGQYMAGNHSHPTVKLEATTSQYLWFWHAYFGMAGSNNDINVLNQSPIFNELLHGVALDRSFQVNGTQYKYGYYLADGGYPDWAVFFKAFSTPDDTKRTTFKKAQEATRKDVERAFSVLKARWAIVNNPARAWDLKKI